MKSYLLWMWLSQAADISSTCYALNTGQFKEANPLLPSSCQNIALTKIGISSIMTGAAIKLDDKHPKLSRWVVGISASSNSIVASINIINLTNLK